MENKFKFWDRPTAISSVVCGVFFGGAAAAYAGIPALKGLLFLFYMGYFLTVAKGPDPKNFKKYVTCMLCGCIWAIPYWYGTDWLMALGMKNLVFTRFITELILNTALVYIHLHILGRTWACIPPYIFVCITAVFSTGGPQNIPICLFSLFCGMSSCILAAMISDKLISLKKAPKVPTDPT